LYSLTPKAQSARHNQALGGTYFIALRTSAATSSADLLQGAMADGTQADLLLEIRS